MLTKPLNFGMMGAASSGGAGAPAFDMNAGNFPGTLSMRVDATTDLIPDSGVFTFSTWVRIDGSDTVNQALLRIYDGSSARFYLRRGTTGQLTCFGGSAAGVTLFTAGTANNVLIGSTGGVCLMISGSRASNIFRIYINDTSVYSAAWTSTAADIGFSNAERVSLAGDWFGTGEVFTGDLGNFVFDTGTYLDLSVEANRRLFIDAGGNPVSLGADGSAPFGYQPDIYMGNNDDYADWDSGLINLGTLKGGHTTAWTKMGTGNIGPPSFF